MRQNPPLDLKGSLSRIQSLYLPPHGSLDGDGLVGGYQRALQGSGEARRHEMLNVCMSCSNREGTVS